MATATGSPAWMLAATAGSSGQVSGETRWTNTSRLPPQVSPAAKASSSLTPYVATTGSPVARTWRPTSNRSPSTQPPLTDPTTPPSAVTSIEEPGGRGAEFHVRTTVAMRDGLAPRVRGEDRGQDFAHGTAPAMRRCGRPDSRWAAALSRMRRPVRDHRIVSAITAFCACSRFSASS